MDITESHDVHTALLCYEGSYRMDLIVPFFDFSAKKNYCTPKNCLLIFIFHKLILPYMLVVG